MSPNSTGALPRPQRTTWGAGFILCFPVSLQQLHHTSQRVEGKWARLVGAQVSVYRRGSTFWNLPGVFSLLFALLGELSCHTFSPHFGHFHPSCWRNDFWCPSTLPACSPASKRPPCWGNWLVLLSIWGPTHNSGPPVANFCPSSFQHAPLQACLSSALELALWQVEDSSPCCASPQLALGAEWHHLFRMVCLDKQIPCLPVAGQRGPGRMKRGWTMSIRIRGKDHHRPNDPPGRPALVPTAPFRASPPDHACMPLLISGLLSDGRQGLESYSELGSSRFCSALESHLSSSGRLAWIVRKGDGNCEWGQRLPPKRRVECKQEEEAGCLLCPWMLVLSQLSWATRAFVSPGSGGVDRPYQGWQPLPWPHARDHKAGWFLLLLSVTNSIQLAFFHGDSKGKRLCENNIIASWINCPN